MEIFSNPPGHIFMMGTWANLQDTDGFDCSRSFENEG